MFDLSFRKNRSPNGANPPPLCAISYKLLLLMLIGGAMRLDQLWDLISS